MKKYEPQTTLKRAKVIKKIGNWTIEIFLQSGTHSRYRLAVTNSWCVDYAAIYSDYTVGYDNPYMLPKSIKNWIEKNSKMLSYKMELLTKSYHVYKSIDDVNKYEKAIALELHELIYEGVN